MHYEILPINQKKLLQKFRGKLFLKPFFLAGGTGLALHLGHRRSIDFDFITKTSVTPKLLGQIEKDIGITPHPLQIDEQTLTVRIGGVKVSFFGKYRFPFLKKPVKTPYFQVSSVKDIFAMKLLTIQQRYEIKDYADIFFILDKTKITLKKGLDLAAKKFGSSFNGMISLKALTYFKDIAASELQSIKFLDRTPSLQELKQKLISAVRGIKLI